MTDEEFQNYHNKLKKERLLGDMFSAANRPFSIKNISKPKKQPEIKDKKTSLINYGSTNEQQSVLKDEDWDAIIEHAYDYVPSPIDEITTRTMGEFTLDDIGIKEEESSYKVMFKKEQAMLAELLKDVTKQAKDAGAKLADMTRKSSGYAGVSKSYPDLVSATNSLNSTRLSIVKEMASLKKTIVDLEMKKAKDMGDAEKTSNDDIADSFYKQIVSNRKQFVEDSMSAISNGTQNYATTITDNNPPEYNGGNYLPDGDIEDEQPTKRVSRSITSPIVWDNDSSDTNSNADPYGYIRNENSNVKICVERYDDGRLNFVAVDDDGEEVDNYELPGDDLLLDLEIRPMSNWATDSMGRRYRIIDVNSDGVDISDILDD